MITTQNSTVPLTYEGPEEVLVKTPVTFQGHYDRETIHNLTLAAEDHCAFQIILDPQHGQWHSSLDEGFYTAGSRWLRLQGKDALGRIVGERVIHLTVSAEPLSVGQGIEMEVMEDTLFKTLPLDSAVLNDRQMLLLKAGQRLPLDRYGYANGYLCLELTQDLKTLGQVGYVEASQVRLHKGRETLRLAVDDRPVPMAGPVQVQVLQDTWLKTHPIDSASLQASQRQRLPRGQTFTILSYGCQQGHFQLQPTPDSCPDLPQGASPAAQHPQGAPPKVSPDRPLPPVVYVPWSHVALSKGGREIPFDAQGLTLTITQDTVFKRYPVNRSNLGEAEFCQLPRGAVYGLLGYSPMGHHVKVALTEHVPGFGNAGYCLRQQVQIRRGTTVVDLDAVQVELNVPYQVPYHLPPMAQRPQGQGALTSTLAAMAMAMAYHGVRSQRPTQSLLEELCLLCQQRHGSSSYLDSSCLVRLVQSYGFEVSFSTHRTWAEVRQRVSQGQPVVVESYCMPQNHGICVIGFTTGGYLVNDPWGNALRGYRDRQGAKLLYSHAYLQQMCRLGGHSLGNSSNGGYLGAYFLVPRRLLR